MFKKLILSTCLSFSFAAAAHGADHAELFIKRMATIIAAPAHCGFTYDDKKIKQAYNKRMKNLHFSTSGYLLNSLAAAQRDIKDLSPIGLQLVCDEVRVENKDLKFIQTDQFLDRPKVNVKMSTKSAMQIAQDQDFLEIGALIGLLNNIEERCGARINFEFKQKLEAAFMPLFKDNKENVSKITTIIENQPNWRDDENRTELCRVALKQFEAQNPNSLRPNNPK